MYIHAVVRAVLMFPVHVMAPVAAVQPVSVAVLVFVPSERYSVFPVAMFGLFAQAATVAVVWLPRAAVPVR